MRQRDHKPCTVQTKSCKNGSNKVPRSSRHVIIILFEAIRGIKTFGRNIILF